MSTGKLSLAIIVALAAFTAFSTYKFASSTVFAPQIPQIMPSNNTSNIVKDQNLVLFSAWKIEFNKQYNNQAEENHRFTIFV